MQIRISKGNDVPIRDQLVELRLIVRRRGSRMVVRSPGQGLDESEPVKDLDDLINAAIRAAQAHGYTFQQLQPRVQERLDAHPPDHVLVVSTDPGMRYLLQAELKQKLSFRVTACSPEELCANSELMTGALVVVPAAALHKITDVLPKDHSPITIHYSKAEKHLEIIRQLEDPSVIAVVSISQALLQTARGVLGPFLGRKHTLREYFLPSENPRRLESFALVFCDSVAGRRLKASNLVYYELISPASLEQISTAMGG